MAYSLLTESPFLTVHLAVLGWHQSLLESTIGSRGQTGSDGKSDLVANQSDLVVSAQLPCSEPGTALCPLEVLGKCFWDETVAGSEFTLLAALTAPIPAWRRR